MHFQLVLIEYKYKTVFSSKNHLISLFLFTLMICLLFVFLIVLFWRDQLSESINLSAIKNPIIIGLLISLFFIEMEENSKSWGQKSSIIQEPKCQIFLERFIQIVDFCIRRGYRLYRSKWARGDGKYIYKWLNFDQMTPSYLKDILDYELGHKLYIKNLENQWLQLFEQNKVKDRLQILNIQKIKKSFKTQEKQQNSQNSSDSSFTINQRGKAKKPILKIKHKKKSNKNRKRKVNAIKNKKKNIEKQIFVKCKFEINNKLQKEQIYQRKQSLAIQTIKLFDNFSLLPNKQIQASLLPQSNNLLKNSLEISSISLEKQAKPTPFQRSIQNDEEIQDIQQEISQSEQVVQNILSDEQQQQSNNQSQYSYQFDQLSFSSDQVSQVVNQNRVKQFIERKLKQIQLQQKEKRKYMNSSCLIQQQSQDIKIQNQSLSVKREFQMNQQSPLIKIQSIEHNSLNIRTEILQIVEDSKEISIPQYFQQYLNKNLISSEQLKQKRLNIVGIMNLYHLNQVRYFSVNVGSTYFQQQKFVQYNLLKCYSPQILKKWMITHQ